MLGSVEGLRVVELGAGIGRFTGELARTAKTVLAVDFMEHLIAENQQVNKRFKNVEWKAADATAMQLPAESCDVIFSNWLLMYLDDAEVSKLATDAILWVRPTQRGLWKEVTRPPYDRNSYQSPPDLSPDDE